LSDIIQSEGRKVYQPPLRGEGALMDRGDWILITTLVALGVAALIATAVITLTEGSEYLEFAIAMVLFIVVLVGSYWFLLAPLGQGEERDNE
jgi:membrane glycosyltransferase